MMDFLKDLVTTGRIADVIIAVMTIEFLLLALVRHRLGSGILPGALLLNLCAGAFLVLALRGGLAGSHWAWIAACILGAGIFHALDLAQRWNKTR